MVYEYFVHLLQKELCFMDILCLCAIQEKCQNQQAKIQNAGILVFSKTSRLSKQAHFTGLVLPNSSKYEFFHGTTTSTRCDSNNPRHSRNSRQSIAQKNKKTDKPSQNQAKPSKQKQSKAKPNQPNQDQNTNGEVERHNCPRFCFTHSNSHRPCRAT